jgi:hypothetical protein
MMKFSTAGNRCSCENDGSAERRGAQARQRPKSLLDRSSWRRWPIFERLDSLRAGAVGGSQWSSVLVVLYGSILVRKLM